MGWGETAFEKPPPGTAVSHHTISLYLSQQCAQTLRLAFDVVSLFFDAYTAVVSAVMSAHVRAF